MKKKIRYRYHGSGPFTKAEEAKGYKVMASASELEKLDKEGNTGAPDYRVRPKTRRGI